MTLKLSEQSSWSLMNRKLELEDTNLLESKNAKPPNPQSGSLFFCHCVMITAWEEREKYLNEALTWLLPGILKYRAQAKKKKSREGWQVPSDQLLPWMVPHWSVRSMCPFSATKVCTWKQFCTNLSKSSPHACVGINLAGKMNRMTSNLMYLLVINNWWKSNLNKLRQE